MSIHAPRGYNFLLFYNLVQWGFGVFFFIIFDDDKVEIQHK